MHVKILQMSQSDVGLPDVQYEKEVGNGLHEKQYDFAYDMSLGGGKNVKNKSASCQWPRQQEGSQEATKVRTEHFDALPAQAKENSGTRTSATTSGRRSSRFSFCLLTSRLLHKFLNNLNLHKKDIPTRKQQQ